MRNCRRCGRAFEPAKPYYWWCSLPCRKADYAEAEGHPYTAHDVGRAYDRGFDAGYARGLADGLRRGRSAQRSPLPLDLYKKLASSRGAFRSLRGSVLSGVLSRSPLGGSGDRCRDCCR
jgi:hypothetical protein